MLLSAAFGQLYLYGRSCFLCVEAGEASVEFDWDVSRASLDAGRGACYGLHAFDQQLPEIGGFEKLGAKRRAGEIGREHLANL